MIKTFSHKGLKRLFERDDPSGVRADQVQRIRAVLAHLDEANSRATLLYPATGFIPCAVTSKVIEA